MSRPYSRQFRPRKTDRAAARTSRLQPRCGLRGGHGHGRARRLVGDRSLRPVRSHLRTRRQPDRSLPQRLQHLSRSLPAGWRPCTRHLPIFPPPDRVENPGYVTARPVSTSKKCRRSRSTWSWTSEPAGAAKSALKPGRDFLTAGERPHQDHFRPERLHRHHSDDHRAMVGGGGMDVEILGPDAQRDCLSRP